MENAAAFVTDLLKWYDRTAADLPWRRSADPYRIWLSEIMLQQTQVATVIPYFERFLAAFPTITVLAAAPLDDVLKCWEGLGYYSRARNLHRTAQQIVATCGGQFPATPGELLKLPGIGRYTANIIASIAFNRQVAALDGNVIRVLTRLYDIAEDVTAAVTQRHLWALASALIEGVTRPGDHNQALMELGREICKPRRPLCAQCPVQMHCLGFRRDVQNARPVKPGKTEAPHYDMAAGVIWNAQGELLIAQRPAEGLLGGLWEFPASRCERGESLIACLTRALSEKLAVRAEIGDLLFVVRHAFTHFKITLHAFECRHPEGDPQPNGYAAWQWVPLADLDRLAFGRADRKIIAYLRERPSRLF